MEIIGKIKLINESKTFGKNDFTKRDLVVTTDEQYPQMILVEFVQDKCDLLNDYTVGQDVKISINIRGREWINPEGEAKYFNSIQGWRIEEIKVAITEGEEQAPPPIEKIETAETTEEEADDLPF